MSIREIFPTQLTWQWSMNMIKVLWCRFQQFFRTFTILLVEASSEMVLFRYLLDYVFRVRIIGSTKSMTVIFFFKTLKFNLDFKNAAKNWKKVFCFWDNCIWIGIAKLSLLRTRYFLSAGNVLTSNPRIWHVNKGDVFQLN